MTCMYLLGIKVAAADFSAVSQDQYHHEIFCAAISYRALCECWTITPQVV